MATLDGTLAQLRADVRTYLDDATQNAWSDAVINNFVNMAYKQVLLKAEELTGTRLTSQSNISFVAEQQEYDLPNGCEVVLDAKDNRRDIPVPFIGYGERYMYTSGLGLYWRTYYGSTTAAYLRNGKIGFVPVPTEAVDDAVTLTYIASQAVLSQDSHVIQIPTKYHELVVLGAVKRAKAARGEVWLPEMERQLAELWA